MNEWVALIVGLVLGLSLGAAAVGLLVIARRGRLQGELADAEARLQLLDAAIEQTRRDIEAARSQRDEQSLGRERAERELARHEERLKAFEDAERRMADMFSALGVKALRGNADEILKLAEQRLAPIKELLEKQTTAMSELEKKRLEDKSGLQEQLKQVAEAHRNLSQETGQLVRALRRPEQRGRWGEVQLRNCVELAGMTKYCDFVEQATIPGERLRPDMLVNLPGEGLIVVDSKVALDAYLDAIECRDDGARAECLRRHAKQVTAHVDSLRSKAYWDHAQTLGRRVPKLVVMFVPLESALVAALEADPELHASAMQKDVLIATPTLLVALLRAVAYGWRQEDVAANAKEISSCGEELYKRLTTFAAHFEGVGKGINAAGAAYDKAIGSLERMVLSSAREMKRLNATTLPEIEPPAPLQIETRPITAAELKPLPAEIKG